jgi:endoglycosylceramidase
MNKKLLQIAGLLLLSACNCSYIKKFFASPKNDTLYLHDKEGRIAIYHGVNISNYSKSAPFLPWQTKEDFAKLKSWGFNLVRYLIFWQAIEPEKGVFDEVYIQKTIDRIKCLQQLGIDVIIDIHQDVYATKFLGNGFPAWTIHDDSLNFTPRTPWNMNYFEPAVIASYNYFWKNEELKTAYITMLKYVLTAVDNIDNVIAIDVMNEPFLGTIPSFEKNVLTKFYNDIQKMMIDINFRLEMAFEPMMYTSAGIPTNLNFIPQRDCFYYPHYYDAFCHEGKPYASLNKTIMEQAIRIKRAEAQSFNSPLLFGEFGISPSVGGHIEYLQDFVKLTNENLIGWTYYTYDKKSVDDFGIVDDFGKPTDLLAPLICVYPQKIAGKNPIVTCSDCQFTLTYDLDSQNYRAATEIFIPDLKNVMIVVNGTLVSRVSNTVFSYNNNTFKRQVIHITWEK